MRRWRKVARRNTASPHRRNDKPRWFRGRTSMPMYAPKGKRKLTTASRNHSRGHPPAWRHPDLPAGQLHFPASLSERRSETKNTLTPRPWAIATSFWENNGFSMVALPCGVGPPVTPNLPRPSPIRERFHDAPLGIRRRGKSPILFPYHLSTAASRQGALPRVFPQPTQNRHKSIPALHIRREACMPETDFLVPLPLISGREEICPKTLSSLVA